MRQVRISPPVVVALVVFSVVALWAGVIGLPLLLGPAPLKRTEYNTPIAVAFTPQEYAQFRAEYPPERRDPLDEYLRQALKAGREVDAIRAVEPENTSSACAQVTLDLIGKVGASQWPKDEAKHGPAVRRLRELRQHAIEPYTTMIDGYLLFHDGQFAQAEAAFATLPAEFHTLGYQRGALWLCRLTGFQKRGQWREAYHALEPRRKIFHILGYRFLDEKFAQAEALEELIRLHRERDPDDLLLPYYTAYLRYHQRRYADVLEPTAEYIRRSQSEWDDRVSIGWWSFFLNMLDQHAFSLAMLGRFEEAGDFLDDSATKLKLGGANLTLASDRVRLAVALKRGDPAAVEKLLSSDPELVEMAHADTHLAPLFMAKKFAKLREKYSPPEKSKK